ncbi:DMT family transporter [Acuticoccus mangrovi]|uniref:DMT family transporter n=1 Tax=Acuticoccus mangrovi TaxID=2796142 RepID=A0A934II65_9HYPH|nr:DMT family transporter [Acuticoccus mangrovi]MBJ3774167.1 DMT family transporter [Acuticoccus mangrovi]
MRPGGATLRGTLCGAGAAIAWAIYNVGVDIGRSSGFTGADLVILRYAVPALLVLPYALTRSRRLVRVGLGRALVLTIGIGPPFSYLINLGFGMAPLAHAVVIGPAMTMIVANTLSLVVERRAIPPQRLLGMAILIVGLALVGFDQPEHKSLTHAPWVGDLCFMGSGFLWGSFTYLLGRWRLDPVDTTATVALISTVLFGPIYVAFFSPSHQPVVAWVMQAIYQGVLGGLLAIIAFAAAISLLGSGRAALFTALVPPLAAFLAVPMSGSVPSLLQWAALLLASLGLIVSLDLTNRRRGASVPVDPPSKFVYDKCDQP